MRGFQGHAEGFDLCWMRFGVDSLFKRIEFPKTHSSQTFSLALEVISDGFD